MNRLPLRLRTTLSFAALLIATVICIAERHVHIVLSDPATYSSPLHHRCGRLLLACLAWAAIELTLLSLPAKSSLPA